MSSGIDSLTNLGGGIASGVGDIASSITTANAMDIGMMAMGLPPGTSLASGLTGLSNDELVSIGMAAMGVPPGVLPGGIDAGLADSMSSLASNISSKLDPSSMMDMASGITEGLGDVMSSMTDGASQIMDAMSGLNDLGSMMPGMEEATDMLTAIQSMTDPITSLMSSLRLTPPSFSMSSFDMNQLFDLAGLDLTSMAGISDIVGGLPDMSSLMGDLGGGLTDMLGGMDTGTMMNLGLMACGIPPGTIPPGVIDAAVGTANGAAESAGMPTGLPTGSIGGIDIDSATGNILNSAKQMTALGI
jgi:hypothetical protein